MPPFVVLALPRSRTAWLARFLTWGDWRCGHDELVRMRALEDVRAWLGQPCIGSVETMAAPYWRLLRQIRPDVRVVTVRRPPADVVDSLMRLDVGFDRAAMARAMGRLDAKLDQIEARLPGVVSVAYDALADASTGAMLFRHCLGLEMPEPWWEAVAPINIQVNMRHVIREVMAYSPQLAKLAAVARRQTLAGMRKPPAAVDGVTFQTEPFDTFYADARDCFEQHLLQTGQAPDGHSGKNLTVFRAIDTLGGLHVFTARSNGRIFSYLVSVISPGLDKPGELLAEQTIFFADPSFPGLGGKIQRAAIADLRARGVHRVLMRAGHRGSGPRLGALYRRLGAEPFGQLYNLPLEC